MGRAEGRLQSHVCRTPRTGGIIGRRLTAVVLLPASHLRPTCLLCPAWLQSTLIQPAPAFWPGASWGLMQLCPYGSLVRGLMLKVETDQGIWVDDTGVNELSAVCNE
jgi:Vitelline membrane outer layer protein I (VOMI)